MGADQGRPSLPACSNTPQIPAHTFISPYMYKCICVCLCSPGLLQSHTQLLPSSLLLSVSSIFLFLFVLGAGVSTRASHTLISTLPQSYSTRFIELYCNRGSKKQGWPHRGHVNFRDSLPSLAFLKDNAQLSPALNQEAEEMEREPGDHSVLLGDFILFPSQHSTCHGA